VKNLLLILAACFLAAGLLGCSSGGCNPSAALVVRSPVGLIHESSPVQMQPARSWVAPSYTAPAGASGCLPAASLPPGCP
jgi:hypothetical protein